MKPRQRGAPRGKHARPASGSQGIPTDAPREHGTQDKPSPHPHPPRHGGDRLLKSELPGLRGRSDWHSNGALTNPALVLPAFLPRSERPAVQTAPNISVA